MDLPVGRNQRPGWQLLLFYLILGTLISGVIYLIFSASSQKDLNAQIKGSYDTRIVYANGGFQPKNIIIKAGDVVTWTNNSSIDISVNSSSHPTHSEYPPLNLGVIKSNESVSLILGTKGIYKYHNHISGNQSGSIIVE